MPLCAAGRLTPALYHMHCQDKGHCAAACSAGAHNASRGARSATVEMQQRRGRVTAAAATLEGELQLCLLHQQLSLQVVCSRTLTAMGKSTAHSDQPLTCRCGALQRRPPPPPPPGASRGGRTSATWPSLPTSTTVRAAAVTVAAVTTVVWRCRWHGPGHQQHAVQRLLHPATHGRRQNVMLQARPRWWMRC